MQYGFNTPGFGPYDCCGDASTCTGPCPADFCSTPTGWTPGFKGFTGYAPSFSGYNGWTPSYNGYNGFNGYAPGFNGYYGGSNWGWNPGFTGYAPSFAGYNGWSNGFTGYTGYANVPGSNPGGNATQNCGPTWTGGCATEAA